MKQTDQTEASLKILAKSQEEIFPYTIEVLGMNVVVENDVFSPKHFNGWKTFTLYFPDVTGLDVLEVGCGTGVTSLYLAKHGAHKVLAIDISPAAVKNTAENALCNNLSNIEARESDVFSGLHTDERFDIIYWNTPFMYRDEAYVYKSMLERGLFDPGYALTNRFLKEAPHYLKDSGYVLFGTADFGDLPRFKKMAMEHGYDCELVAKEDSTEINPVSFHLYKLLPQTQ